MDSPFIDDDFTCSDTVPAFGAFPEFRYTYRIAQPERVADLQRKVRDNPRQEFAIETEAIEKGLVSWSVQIKGEAVPITAYWIKKLHARARAQMLNAITCYTAPEAEADAKN